MKEIEKRFSDRNLEGEFDRLMKAVADAKPYVSNFVSATSS